MNSFFRMLATKVSNVVGRPMAFVVAVGVIVVWAVTGPIFNFSNTWQLFINTGTTIVTLLMVFLIQNTQNRDGKAIQIKLDELIKATTRASNTLVDLEDQEDEVIDQLHEKSKKLRKHYKGKLEKETKK